jgi:ribA/ribD-fused uncharacterized protein
MRNVIQFHRPAEPYGELSTFWPSEMTIEGTTFRTAEHAFQAAKYLGPSASALSRAYAGVIIDAPSPLYAKILGTRVCYGAHPWQCDLRETIGQWSNASVRADWRHVQQGVMLAILRQKFTDPQCATVLLSTAGSTLVQHSTDRYWGDGLDGVGSNYLGRLLEKVRGELLLADEQQEREEALAAALPEAACSAE